MAAMMRIPDKFVKVEPLPGSEMIEAVGYAENTKRLYVKLRKADALIQCYEEVPRFRHNGLMTAARKDEYFKNFIKSSFLCKEVKEIPGHH
jgi:hypothetical protein